MFYSPSTKGFYDEGIHGERIIEHVQTDLDTGETVGRWTESNPDCRIPADAVEITAEEHAALLEAQSFGHAIEADANGFPVAIAPPPPTISELIARKLAEINARCESAIAAISAGYPASEVLSWPKQESEARAFAADANAVTPLLDALAAARGIPKAELAARVIAKADLFAQFSGQIIGKRQALEDAISALPADANAANIDAIRWEA